MAVKTEFSPGDFTAILAGYALGDYQEARALTTGTVQTNYLLQTTQGRFVFRYYENRSPGSVAFETALLRYLTARQYPCPAPFKNRQGQFVGSYRGKPYVLFEFLPGQHVETPNEKQQQQFVEKVAQLHRLTRGYRPPHTRCRWNYSPALCRDLAQQAAQTLDTADAWAKLAWVEHELSNLSLPQPLPKGICHCDLHFSNALFNGDELTALIDFDDANYTYLIFDLVGLIESRAWRYDQDAVLQAAPARRVIEDYTQYRGLNATEQRHLFDVYKLSILFDCIWYFRRGGAADFYEKGKIAYLNGMGRDEFYARLFG